jgi:hypothetical protein
MVSAKKTWQTLVEIRTAIVAQYSKASFAECITLKAFGKELVRSPIRQGPLHALRCSVKPQA